MLNLIKMERYQLFRNRIYQISTLAVFVLGFLMADTYLIDSPGNPGGEPKTLTDIWNSMIYDSTFLLILLSCLLAFLLGQEFSCRTIDREITAGHSRSHIFAAR
ncbi:MAG: ABC transporter permease, partial [Eisenbergiella massiliensis]